MEGDWELIFLFIVVISTRSFDLCKSYSLSTRSPRSYSRAIAHNFHPRSMIWRLSSRVILERCHLELRDFQIIVINFFFIVGNFIYRFLVLLEGGENPVCIFLRADVDHLSVEICRVVFLFERKRRLDFDFPSMFFFIHCYYWGWEKWGHRSTYFHIHYFSLFSKCSDNKSMR